jgi:hypothetical protein
VPLEPGRRGVDPEEPEGIDRSALALQGELHGLDPDRVAHEPGGLRADEDLAGLGDLLEPSGHVHGVADDERVALARHDLARVHADPGLEAERGHGLHELGRGPHRPERVVLVGQGDAEDRHHGVADELLDRPAVPLEHLPGLLVVAAHRRPDGLWVEPLAHRGRPGQVAEEDGDGLSHLPGLPERAPRSARRSGNPLDSPCHSARRPRSEPRDAGAMSSMSQKRTAETLDRRH